MANTEVSNAAPGAETPDTAPGAETPDTAPDAETPDTAPDAETPATAPSAETPDTAPGAETPSSTILPVIWQSGDWQSSPNMSPPYNGLEVQATPVYSNTGAIESIAVTIIDYTLVQKGAKTLQDFTLSHITNETAISIEPQPDSTTLNGSSIEPQPDPTTLNGSIKFRLLQGAPDFANLFLNLSYGLPSPSNKDVQGCILQIPLNGSI